MRPFTVVKAMEAEANEKYQEKLTGLEAQLSAVQAKLTELAGQEDRGQPPDRLPGGRPRRSRSSSSRRPPSGRNAAGSGSRSAQDIDALEHRLLAINLFATPLLVCAFGVWFYRARKQSR